MSNRKINAIGGPGPAIELYGAEEDSNIIEMKEKNIQ